MCICTSCTLLAIGSHYRMEICDFYVFYSFSTIFFFVLFCSPQKTIIAIIPNNNNISVVMASMAQKPASFSDCCRANKNNRVWNGSWCSHTQKNHIYTTCECISHILYDTVGIAVHICIYITVYTYIRVQAAVGILRTSYTYMYILWSQPQYTIIKFMYINYLLLNQRAICAHKVYLFFSYFFFR